jgi:hypothetical protein
MRGDQIVQNQLLMAQAFGALADTVKNSHGFVFRPMTVAALPALPLTGTIVCVNDSSVTSGELVGGGFQTVIAFYNGASWRVIGA